MEREKLNRLNNCVELVKELELRDNQNKLEQQKCADFLIGLLADCDDAKLACLASINPELTDRNFLETIPSMNYKEFSEFRDRFYARWDTAFAAAEEALNSCR